MGGRRGCRAAGGRRSPSTLWRSAGPVVEGVGAPPKPRRLAQPGQVLVRDPLPPPAQAWPLRHPTRPRRADARLHRDRATRPRQRFTGRTPGSSSTHTPADLQKRHQRTADCTPAGRPADTGAIVVAGAPGQAGPGRAGPGRARPGRAGPGRAGPSRAAEQTRAALGEAHPRKRPARPRLTGAVDVCSHYGRKRPPPLGAKPRPDVCRHYRRKRPAPSRPPPGMDVCVLRLSRSLLAVAPASLVATVIDHAPRILSMYVHSKPRRAPRSDAA